MRPTVTIHDVLELATVGTIGAVAEDKMNVRTALPKLLLNVPALAHQSPDVVERILGRPERSCGAMVSQHQKVMYRAGKVEVVYTDGKASWIKLYATRDLKFNHHSLSRLGLPPKKPTYVNRNHVMSWSGICNLREVSLYSDSHGGVSSVLVCANSPVLEPASMKRSGPATRSGRSVWTRPISFASR